MNSGQACKELNLRVLEPALAQLPNLQGLHIIECPQIQHATVLSLCVHMTSLEGLSMTTLVSCSFM
jgi:hypothetical protein